MKRICMTVRLSILAFGGTLVLCADTNAALVPTNLLTNGGFESGLSPWTTSGNVGRNGNAARASEGAYSLSFSVGAQDPTGVVEQAFTTVAGQTYALKFDLGSFGSPTQYARFLVEVEGTGTVFSSSEDAPLAIESDVTYRTARLQFTADSTSSTLRLDDKTEDTPGGAGAVDGYLDAFSIVAGQTISPSGEGTLGTVHYLGGNLALDDDEDPATPNDAGLLPTATSSSTKYGSTTSGGNDGEGIGRGYNGDHSWHADESPEFWTVDLGTLAGYPNGPNHTYAIESVRVHSRAEDSTVRNQSDGFVQVFDDNGNPATPEIAVDFYPDILQVADFEPSSVFGREITYTDMRSFNELEVYGLPDLDFNVASTMLLDIDASGNDFINVEGDAVLAGTIVPVLPASAGLGAGDYFDVLTAASIELADTLSIDGSMTDAGGAWWRAMLIDHGGSQTLRLSLVPEPGSFCLLLLGTATLLLRRRRQAH